MKLSGDPEGLEELKRIKEENLFYLKFIMKEAKSNTDNMTVFKDKTGHKRYRLSYNPTDDSFTVTAADG
ncbi:MAG: hypothetical protein M1491_05095 [Deltaproteobacteria bacterium]|nr:hypothetical protein [Deltaproteobacteria bacterium]MCL5277857.1 hypothetical protein [Deltaproteobacteria bacterium]